MKVKLYRTYLFKDKCPSIDYLRTAQQKTGVKISKIARDSGVAHGTLRNWFTGSTRRPQFATMVAAARAIGPEGVAALANCVRDGGGKKR